MNNACRVPLILALCFGIAGCDPATLGGVEKPEPGVFEATRNGPPGAAPGTCWGRTVSPAVIETITKQVQVKPAKVNPDGTIGAPPVYKTEARQQIVSERVDNWFETPCPEALSAEFNASLQRALSVRGYYIGQINGKMDAETRAAVQAFQRLEGPDSGVLSLATARKLGLIAVERTPSE
ncbi:MAG: peptidoglycan-binding domain-containing protein [Sulfitobacter sp.]